MRDALQPAAFAPLIQQTDSGLFAVVVHGAEIAFARSRLWAGDIVARGLEQRRQEPAWPLPH